MFKIRRQSQPDRQRMRRLDFAGRRYCRALSSISFFLNKKQAKFVLFVLFIAHFTGPLMVLVHTALPAEEVFGFLV